MFSQFSIHEPITTSSTPNDLDKNIDDELRFFNASASRRRLLLNPPYELTLKISNLVLPFPNTQKLDPPPRPPNAFMIFRRDLVAKLKSMMDKPWEALPHNSIISKVAGRLWDEESKEVRNFFYVLADIAMEEHLKIYPGYRFNPKNIPSSPESEIDMPLTPMESRTIYEYHNSSICSRSSSSAEKIPAGNKEVYIPVSAGNNICGAEFVSQNNGIEIQNNSFELDQNLHYQPIWYFSDALYPTQIFDIVHSQENILPPNIYLNLNQ
ncbi:1061_t:CDS:2 [Ambispora gerdemannii]|uniref:1061_t:CDS:1 n=1 Tax=Ambispora gerdemannii TaxID=144530 RepID=A0A9N9AFD3_9GLOM|nr:1061_t:CDS:2 [Ambispora gerdemannii]